MVIEKALLSEQVNWKELMAELYSVVSSTLLPNHEQLLINIIQFDGPLNVVECELHSAPPLGMLKSIAVQGLVKRTGLKHYAEIQKLQEKSESSLASLIKDVIDAEWKRIDENR